MADLSFLSDSSDEGAIEELLNQAMDHSVLEQIAKINCSSFSSDSVLPTQLENRFSRLKSFPVTNQRQPNFASSERFGGENDEFEPHPLDDDEFEENPVGENESKRDLGSRSDSFPSKSSKLTEKSKIQKSFGGKSEPHSPSDDEFGENELKRNLRSKSDYFSSKSSKSTEKSKFSEKNLRTRSGSSRSNSSTGNALGERKGVRSMEKGIGLSLSRSNSSDLSPSPPKRSGCFWCSSKKGSGKKNMVNRGIGDELLSDLSILSAKEQRKLMVKAMREEEKINRKAEKIVQWAKQGSARMNISDIDD